MVFDFFYYRLISLHYYLLLSMIPQLSNFRGTIAVNLTFASMLSKYGTGFRALLTAPHLRIKNAL